MLTVKVKVKDNSITLPQISDKHCNMSEVRKHPVLGQWAGKVMFNHKLHRYLQDRLPKTFSLDQLPEGVEVDTSEFLAVVTIRV